MIGHKPLLEMRRKGMRPAEGVRIDAGLIDMQAPLVWARNRWPYAVVFVSAGDHVPGLDFRFVHGLPVVIAVNSDLTQAAFDAITAGVWANHPSSLSFLHIDAQGYPVDAYALKDGAHHDLDPLSLFLKAFS